jgi:hypothetical protein
MKKTTEEYSPLTSAEKLIAVSEIYNEIKSKYNTIDEFSFIELYFIISNFNYDIFRVS